MVVSAELAALLICVVMAGGSAASNVPTVYDVLRLVYQVCSTEESHRQGNLDCVSYHMGTEVTSAVQQCMSEKKNSSAVDVLCDQLTQVEEWTAKHKNPPPQLTRVVGLAALGRMACVLGEVQRPVTMWQAAFTKCFPDYRHGYAVGKDSSKGRSDNVLGRDSY
uniref:U47-Liphistoxin-Lth1a_1 n=1 Tax=Liphistius thaleban TaxID=1905330 RepID=A0A4Q8K6Q6_9ARAC